MGVEIELPDLFCRSSGFTEILSINCTEPEVVVEVVVEVVEADDLEAEGLRVLQPVNSRKRVKINMALFNIFSTDWILAQCKDNK